MIRAKAKGVFRTVARGPRTSKVRGAGLLLSAMMLLPAWAEAQQVPPNEAWRTLETERARVTFPARLEELARRAAYRTEVALSELEASFLPLPRGTIDVLVTDHTDFSNGFAQVTPSNRVTIYARPPVDEPGLGYFDDWLDLVITHELAHIVHLDHTANPVGKTLRTVFGRVPSRWPYFPGHSTPRWLTEGLATWYESELAGGGRTHGTFQEMQLRAAVLGGRFEQVGSASGASPVWPGGSRPYAYGALFFDHMLERYGDDRMAAFAEAVAGQWIPYRLNAAGRSAFGVSLSDAWREWGDSLSARYAGLDETLASLGPVTEPERVTEGARWAVEPSVAGDGTLAYVRSDGRSDTRIVLDPTAGGRSGSERVNGIASFDWMPGGALLVGQLEYEGAHRLFSDLYVIEPGAGARRVTEGARLAQPAASPDGRWAIAVQEGEGTSGLVRVDLETGAVTPLVVGTGQEHWAYPAVSPDGSLVAATRWQVGGYHDVVILDASTGRLRSELTRDRAMDLAPGWSPDGRWVVWASDRTGILNVLAAEIDPVSGTTGAPRLLTNVRTGVSFPSVSPDGSTLYLSVYHADGWDVGRVPFDPGSASVAPDPASRFTPDMTFVDGRSSAPIQDYSPLPTLRPRYWQPQFREAVRAPAANTSELVSGGRELLGFAVGARTGGRDLLGIHAFDAFARVFTSGGKAEGGLAYAFAGLPNPVFSVGATQFWDDDGRRLGQAGPSAPIDTLFVLERERRLFASAAFRMPTWRHRTQLTLTGAMVQEARELLDNDLAPSTTYSLARPDALLGEARATLGFSTARSHAFQIGASRGVDLFLSGRTRRELSVPDTLRGVVGGDRSVGDVVGRIRGYLPLGGPGHASHVLAVQASAGMAGGPNAPGGHFEVGGASGVPESLTGLSLYGGSPIFFSVRGYATGSRAGRQAWTASGEYRFPLRLVHRGLGAWPLYLGRVVGALFADAGDAWDPGGEGFLSPGRSPLVSVGAEIGAEIVALYDFGLFTRVGVANPLAGGVEPSVYLRIGVPF